VRNLKFAGSLPFQLTEIRLTINKVNRYSKFHDFIS
jgi:hypothetical protein